jgi:hypothetical protein
MARWRVNALRTDNIEPPLPEEAQVARGQVAGRMSRLVAPGGIDTAGGGLAVGELGCGGGGAERLLEGLGGELGKAVVAEGHRQARDAHLRGRGWLSKGYCDKLGEHAMRMGWWL